MNSQEIVDYVMNTPHNTNPTILKQMLDGRTVSWNDLKDKPFYEEITEVGGDTLTWDGNTEGLLSTDTGNMWLISEAALTLDDCTDGGSSTIWEDDGAEKVTNFTQAHFMPVIDGVIILGLYFVSVAEYASGKVVEALGCTFPKAGVYAMNAGKKQSLTINGYTGFITTKTVAKPIDTKYLPEHLQFGTETKVVAGDTIELAIDSTGMEPFFTHDGMEFFYLSDAVVTLDDLVNGYTVKFINLKGENKEVSYTTDTPGAIFYFEQGKDKAIGIWETSYICVAEDNYEASSEFSLVFPKKGIYLYGNSAVNGLPPASITIPGYTGFIGKQTVVKPLDEKYLPTLTSPSGKKFKLSVNDNGTITATEV